MSTSVSDSKLFSLTRVISHVRQPLYLNGYALILSSAATSILGMVYWILAARSYTTEAVGLNSAAISAMMFLAGIAQLNLASALIRFIPGARQTTGRLVIYAYLISVILAAVISFIFILGLGMWAPKLSRLVSLPFFMPWFILASMGWCIFVLQDSVLTGLRQAIWVPIENTVFAGVKIVLLIIFAGSFPRYGVFASWTIALVITLLPTNMLLFRRLIPQQVQAAVPAEPVVPSQVIKYVAADYIGSLFWLVSTTFLPVIVTEQVGASANAYFYLAWTIAYSLYLVSPNMGSALIVEAATDQAQLRGYSYRVLVDTARLLVPVVALVVLGAPYILRIFGSDYAAEGTTLLRLLALSALPNIINALYISIARVQRRMTSIVVVLAALCVLVLGMSYLLLPVYGITGVGLAWLVSQTIVAGGVWLARLRTLWPPPPDDEGPAPRLRLAAVAQPGEGGFATPVGLAAQAGPEAARPNPVGGASLVVPPQTWTGLDRFRLMRLMHAGADHLHLIPLLRWLWDYQSNCRTLARARKLLPDLLATIPRRTDMGPLAGWTVYYSVRTFSDMSVIAVGPPDRAPAAILKLPRTAAAGLSLRHEHRVLAALRTDPRLDEWTTLLPGLLAEGELAGQAFVIEQMLPGLEARRVLANPAICRRIQVAAAAAIGEFHRRTAVCGIVTSEMLERWLDEPLHLMQEVMTALPESASNLAALQRLRAELYRALAGRTLSTSWIHGDFVPGNILVTPDGTKLTGIIDWELARPNDLPCLDQMQLLLSTRMLVQHREAGDIVPELLNGVGWSAHERTLLAAAQATLSGEAIGMREMLLLCWVRHIAANLTKSTRYAGNWLWVTKNIEGVLKCL